MIQLMIRNLVYIIQGFCCIRLLQTICVISFEIVCACCAVYSTFLLKIFLARQKLFYVFGTKCQQCNNIFNTIITYVSLLELPEIEITNFMSNTKQWCKQINLLHHLKAQNRNP